MKIWSIRPAEFIRTDMNPLPRGDPVEFAQTLADPDRIREAEQSIGLIRSGKPLPKTRQPRQATVTRLQPRKKS